MESVARIGKTLIPLEVVKDTEAIRKGLSSRETLAADRGMLFIFPKPKHYRFWMRDMKFPIDIIWIHGDKVVGITADAQNDFDPKSPYFHTAPEKADCVLEVNAGFADKHAIKVGDSVTCTGVKPAFEVVPFPAGRKDDWNHFVEENHPVVGAFLETWEWGEFQKNLGKKIDRYAVIEKDDLVAVFTLVTYRLPLGLSYGYMPRGPIIATEHMDAEAKHFEILQTLQVWAKSALSDCIFLRTEPSLPSMSRDIDMYGFHKPSYTIQPPHNTLVPLTRSEEDILAHFHPSTRSNVKRAERRGVTFEMKKEFGEADYGHFFSMIKSTIARNHGKKAYPSEKYLRTFISTHRTLSKNDPYDPEVFSLGIFCGYQNGTPAATHIVVFFGDTATYLFGASYTEHLNSKVDTYLHFSAMREAKRLGMRHYDLGGIDERVWPSLTNFKRQFGGDEVVYVGNIDVPIKPSLYHGYNFLKKTMKKLRKQV